MKYFKILSLAFSILIFSFINVCAQQHTVTNTATDFEVNQTATLFQFDIYTLRTSTDDFNMGSSSFFIRYNIGNFTKASISNVNPRYSADLIRSGTGSYDPMQVFTYPSGRVGVQIFYNGNGSGDTITGNPGGLGYGERICTVTLEVLSLDPPNLRWDDDNTAVINPQNQAAVCTNNGSYDILLPVELTSFVSHISGNDLTLNWSTATETNNSGFDIERKLSDGSWSKIGFVSGYGNSNEPRNYSYKDNSLQVGTYGYRLKQIDFNGNYEYFELSNFIDIGIPNKFELSQNYPNPFNPATNINFSLPYDSRVSLLIYDMSGRLISTILNNEFKTANYYALEFNSNGLSSGVYFYTIRTEKNTETKKMTLIK